MTPLWIPGLTPNKIIEKKLLPIGRAALYKKIRKGTFGSLVEKSGKYYFVRKKNIPLIKKIIMKGE